LRYYRNGIKYYGTILNKEYAEKVLKFMEKMYTLLK
jgi:HEPN domain-containing protein